jgi:hypothetical protein
MNIFQSLAWAKDGFKILRKDWYLHHGDHKYIYYDEKTGYFFLKNFTNIRLDFNCLSIKDIVADDYCTKDI